MLKSMKKLKFWSRKRKRKTKTHHLISLPHHSPPPPPPSRPPPPPPPLPPPPQPWCCSHSRAEPSAPPLPPSWFTYDCYATAAAEADDTPFLVLPECHERPALMADERSLSRHPHAAPGPVYGIPVPERAGGAGSGLLGFGIHLISCFLPCYRIR